MDNKNKMIGRFMRGTYVGSSSEWFARWLVSNGFLRVNRRAFAQRGNLSDEALRRFAPTGTVAVVDHDGDICFLE